METSVSKIIIKLDDKKEIERLISILNLGICTGLKQRSLTISEAESYLYSPYTMEQLKKIGIAQELIDLIHLGTELEDLESLLPEKLNDGIEEIQAKTIEFMKTNSSDSSTVPRPKWLQKFD
ncbi:DUF3969 family protein [Gloeocapsa sp. PCC 73106]|uniref:DUF3969 family protein n=1 Tax=Gloeocapsa sp. PCC 73106 TaxID=102232 RepID=UPI0002AC580D|nr:DUF3969 family protein [Gloeocapsa sp. PCC 73106]ELR99522.1 hypothetical protein GLO73106DRAFT_00033740 [Gloeocapsa sp. PCC 73106]